MEPVSLCLFFIRGSDLKVLFFVLLFLTLTKSYFLETKNNLYLQIDCKIYNQDNDLIIGLPGFTCSFSPNGEWLSLVGSNLFLYNKDNTVKYKFPYKVHHELKFSNDGKKIYFLSSEIKIFKGKKTRFDIINISDNNGHILAQWKSSDHLSELYQELSLNLVDSLIPFQMYNEFFAADEQHEFSHINAIYEIPANHLENDLSYLKQGNLIITFNGLGSVAVFDPQLKRIEHFFQKILNAKLFGFHDAQILANGHLIMFKNLNERAGNAYTSIEEYDIQKEKIFWSFEFKEPQFKLNEISGAVQVLENNNILIAENSFGGRSVELNRDGIIQWEKYNDFYNTLVRKPKSVFRAKKLDLTGFLKNNSYGKLNEQ
jgi:hypothetical protein